MWIYLQALYQNVFEADSEQLQNDLDGWLLKNTDKIQQQ